MYANTTLCTLQYYHVKTLIAYLWTNSRSAKTMTKRLYTADKVLADVDDDQDYDDPDEPVMEGSDDEFSDLELDKDIDIRGEWIGNVHTFY